MSALHQDLQWVPSLVQNVNIAAQCGLCNPEQCMVFKLGVQALHNPLLSHGAHGLKGSPTVFICNLSTNVRVKRSFSQASTSRHVHTVGAKFGLPSGDCGSNVGLTRSTSLA